ncbi:MAG: xanthine dehydrogenase small subunit [Bacteroidota bacterium]
MNDHKVRFVHKGKTIGIDLTKEKISPTTTVLRFLRENSGCHGTKEGCAEGDCGACTVVLGESDKSGKMQYSAVDSCLLFLPMLHGKQLITVEDLSEEGKLHPVQQAMVDCNGTQCGYCTPGFVMSLLALKKQAGSATHEDIEDALTGNLCRCTGYRPIIEAAESALKNKLPDSFDHNAKATAELLDAIPKEQHLEITTHTQRYFRPATIEEAVRLKAIHPELILFSGATDLALRVTKRHEVLTDLLDLSGIESLKSLSITEKDITIGSGCSLETIRTRLKKELPALTGILDVFGSRQIRSLATLGGNLGSASPIGDTLPVLMAYEAKVRLTSLHGQRTIPMSDFITGYRTTVRTQEELITHIIIPIPDQDLFIRSYKVSKRRDLDISTLSGAFRLRTHDGLVKDALLAFGGMAAKTERALAAEEFLIGKPWSQENAETAAELVRKHFHPISDARSGAAFRQTVSGNLILKFWHDSKNR